MAQSILDAARDYVPPKTTHNIADLDKVNVNVETVDETYTDGEGKDFTVRVATIEGERYRVPVSVLKQLQVILKAKPELNFFKVVKSGTGMNTEYTVVPL